MRSGGIASYQNLKKCALQFVNGPFYAASANGITIVDIDYLEFLNPIVNHNSDVEGTCAGPCHD